jgi:3D (Asp-Asp-Asp) domain-containing protein
VGLSGCTSTSTSLTSLANQTVPTAANVTGASPASGTTLSVPAVPPPTAPLSPVPAAQIAGIPVPVADAPAQIAPNDPVAIPKPVLASASAPASAPEVIRSVPRTPVVNRPTNQIMMVRTTAYTHSESDHIQYGRKSAAGGTLKYGSQVRSAAADWSKYPLGTRFMIEGLPYEYVVDDYGSALVGTETIDIYKPEKGSMNNWGVRNVPIRVLEWGSFEESRRILDERKHVRHADHVREMLHEIEKKARKGDSPGVRKA